MTMKTYSVVSLDDDDLDLGWAQASRDREAGTITVQCWGCGTRATVPDSDGTLHFTFNHRDGCTVARAIDNRTAGLMPQ